MKRVSAKKNFSNRIMIGITIAVFIVTSWYLMHIFKLQQNDVKANLSAATSQTLSNIEDGIYRSSYAIKYYMDNSIASHYEKGESFEECLRHEAVVNSANMIAYTTIFGAHDEKTAYSYKAETGEEFDAGDLSGYKFISKAFDGKLAVSESSILIEELGRQAFAFAVPIEINGSIIGVHVAFCDEKVFENLLSVHYNDEVSYAAILDRDYGAIANYKVDRAVSEETFKSLEYYADYGNVNQLISSRSKGGSFFERVSADENRYGILKAKDGTLFFASMCKMSFNDWVLLIIAPVDKVNVGTRNAMVMNMAVAILVAIGLLLAINRLLKQRKERERAFEQIAFYDELTELYNDEGFKREISWLLEENPDDKYAIAYIDIDNFKTINEIYGTSEGDSVLKHTAQKVREVIGEAETCARIGGDNFFIFIKYNNDDDIIERIIRLMDSISEYDFNFSTKSSFKLVSYCGVYKISPSNRNKAPEFFIDRTKMSMMRVTKNHKNGYAFYNDEVRKNIVFETELENDMHQALEDGEFLVYIQPKYDIRTEKLAGAEALIRWQHHEKGFLTPNRFVHVFEQNGFIINIDNFVFEEVCKKIKEWIEAGIEPVPISVNQSRLHLFEQNYVEWLEETIKKYDIPIKYIELEITENIAFENVEVLVNIIQRLHEIGFAVSMDDFGSGYSSLNLLKDMDIDVLKLDRQFFSETSNNEKGQRIIDSVLGMANKLNIKTVSEGVETKEQNEFLKKVGCDMAQGYYYAKPMPMSDFERILREANE